MVGRSPPGLVMGSVCSPALARTRGHGDRDCRSGLAPASYCVFETAAPSTIETVISGACVNV
jgi:hypothetical protein